ncbi:MAG TPA: tetratricopeptide repeat protein [Coriobacteriia bacterium]|jgi:tetratricopeptide (TPR) repeat protein
MPRTRSQHVAAAEQLAREGRYAKAAVEAWDALADRNDPLPRIILAEVMLADDFYEPAIRFATEAIELDPDCAPAYLALGLAYDRRGGMWDQSILVWHELAEVVPDLVTAHVQLGEALATANFDEEAIDAWKTALALDPREPRAMYDLAVAALKREGVATALPGFRKAGELDPSGDELFLAMLQGAVGSAAVPGRGDPKTRGEKLRAALDKAWYEDLFGAMDYVRSVLDADHEDAEALALAAWIYLKQEAVNEAVACAARALALAPDEPPALYVLGVAYAKRPGLAAQAAEVFSRLAAAVPNSALPHVLLAETLLGLQLYAQAGRSFRRAVTLDPTCVRARFGLATAYLTEGRHADANWEMRRAAYYDTRRKGHFWRLYDAYVGGGDEE